MISAVNNLRRRLFDLGFDDVRFARIESPPTANLPAWLAAGYHADMDWIERTAAKRLDPDQVLSGAKSVIALGISYWSERSPGPANGPRWARYALHDDYHDTFKGALVAAGRALEEIYGVSSADYRYYTDTGPVLERAWAARAGVGFIGKNAMLISRTHGNWLLLGAILTRLELADDRPPATAHRPPSPPVGELCGTCTRCLDACPTNAFPAPGVLDARRCISYQTIENRGFIPRELRVGIGHRIFGCDVCLEVCPWNRFAQEGRRLLLTARDHIAALNLREILQLDPAGFARAFKGTPIKRLKLPGLLRNACIVAGNSGDQTLVDILLPLTSHPAAIVRGHAIWAIKRLANPADAASLLGQARSVETDPEVSAEF